MVTVRACEGWGAGGQTFPACPDCGWVLKFTPGFALCVMH